MMNTDLVSIMMPAFNAERYIGLAVQSVISQSYPNWELIVVDDGSTDGTVGVVKQFTDPRIKLIHQPNAGEAAARNKALDSMQGEFIAFLDADDLFLPDHLEITVGFLNQHNDLDGVYTDGSYCDQDGALLQRLSSRRRGPFQGWIFDQLVRASDVFGPPVCVVLRRDLIVQQDLYFDPRIIIGPDWDFFIRFAEYATFGYINQQTCLYRVHQANITMRTKRQKRAESLTLCREKAIKLKSFSRCSLGTRSYAFYDLLVNLLTGCPEKQSVIINWPEFMLLPHKEQSRLLRLMSSREISRGRDHLYARIWLEKSHQLDPRGLRSTLLLGLFSISPVLCGWVLRIRQFFQAKPSASSPFGELL